MGTLGNLGHFWVLWALWALWGLLGTLGAMGTFGRSGYSGHSGQWVSAQNYQECPECPKVSRVQSNLMVLWGSWMLYTRTLEVVHKEGGGCTYTKKLEVVHKEVGGCTQGSWRLSWIMNEWRGYVWTSCRGFMDILLRLCGWEGKYRATLAAKKIAELVKACGNGKRIYILLWYVGDTNFILGNAIIIPLVVYSQI